MSLASVGAASGQTDIVSVKDFGAIGNGQADDTGAIQAAFNAASVPLGQAGGGTVLIPAGIYRCAGPLFLDGRSDVVIEGHGELRYSGTGPAFITMKSAQRISWRNLRITYSNPGFTGNLVSAGTTGMDPGYLWFDNVSLMGVDGATSARALIDLYAAIIVEIARCRFVHAQLGIFGCYPSYANVVGIRACTFFQMGTAAIKNAGESWVVDGCCFEPLTNGRGVAYVQDLVYYARGLTFSNNWFGDVSQAGGAWITTRALGVTLLNNRMMTTGGTSRCAIFDGCQAVNLQGNRFEGTLDFGVPYSWGVAIVGNDFAGSVALGMQNIVGLTAIGNNNFANVTQ